MSRGLGRLPSPPDSRDWNLQTFMVPTKRIRRSRNWKFPHEPLDQGETPHCVGFSCAGFGINLPTHIDFTNKDGDRFYYICKIIDGEPERENGSSIRSAAKALQQQGRLKNYAFARSVDDIRWWVLNRGPVIVGTEWTEDMFNPDGKYHIHPFGRMVGGHAYLINEYTWRGFFGIQNSWGTAWGKNGKAYISFKEFEILFSNGGEAMTAVELPME